MKKKDLNSIRKRREKRTRAKIAMDKETPRLSVFRSNKYIYAQLINDSKGITIVSASSKGIKESKKLEAAKEIGKTLAEKAKKAGINKIVFDRGRYAYHGRVKALAEGAREVGLKF